MLDPIRGHSNWVTSVAFSPEGSRIVSGSRDKTIRVWDAQNGQAMLDPIKGHSNSVTSVAFSPDSSRIVSGSQDKTIQVWDAQNGQAMLDPIKGHSNSVTSITLSPHNSQMISGSHDHTTRVWRVGKGQTVTKATFLHDYPYPSLWMDEIGWIHNQSGDLLLWVPPQFRPSLHIQPLEYIIGGPITKIELLHAVYHGNDWQK
jgi:WD40 repeat protein